MSFGEDIVKIVEENATGLLGKHASWHRVPAAQVIEIINGFPFESKGFNNEKGTPVLRIRDILKGKTETFFEGKVDPKACYVSNGDIVIGMDGDFNSCIWQGGLVLLNQRVCKVETNQAFYDQKFFSYLLPGYLRAIHAQTSAVTVKHLSSNTIKEIPLPLPPFNEQKRIVDKIEQLFSNLDEGEALLKQVQKQLATYRQSVLKAAVTGELTKEWREANNHRLESGDALLKRILKARRENWKGRGKYAEPVAPDTVTLQKIPEKWTWASLDQLLTNIEAGKSFRCLERPPESHEKGLVKISAVTWGVFNETESKTVTDETLVNERWLIKKGDFLFSRANTLELVGACVIVKNIQRQLFLSDKVLRFIFAKDISEWTNTFLKSSLGRKQIEQLATGNQLSMRNISQESIKKICIPLCPNAEMQQINDLVSDIFSQIDALETWCASELSRSATLRQSILKDAFSGKLVPQDPSDEPAGELLKRIQAKRAKATKTTKPKSSAPPRPRGRRKIKESV